MNDDDDQGAYRSTDAVECSAVLSNPVSFSTLGRMHGHGTGRAASIPRYLAASAARPLSATLCLCDGEPEGRLNSHLEDEDEDEKEEE